MIKFNHFARLILATTFLAGCAIEIANGDDWNLWRGPNCNGSVAAHGFFGTDPIDLEVLWSKPVGSAYSSVSIANGNVLTMFTDGQSDFVGTFELSTGRLRWRFRLGSIYKAHDGGHDGPVSTPVADEHHVYALGPRGRLVAVDIQTGQKSWSFSLPERYQAKTPFWGFCTTPVVHQDLLIVQVDGGQGRGVIGFDKSSGSRKWHCSCGTVDYRSPVITTTGDTAQVIFSGPAQTTGIDAQSGKTIWTYPGGIANDKTPLPIAGNRLLLVHNRGSELIQLNPAGESPRRLWNSLELRGNFDVPVFHDGYFYGYTGRYLTCVDAGTGKRVWRSRPPGGKGLIVVDGHLVTFGDKGDVVIVEATPEGYQEKARQNVSDGASDSWPGFADETIVVRNLRHMVAMRPVRKQTARLAADAPTNRFARFVQQVERSPNKQALIDSFLATRESLPIIEDERLIHFVYQGPARDVGIRGNMLASGEEDEMWNIPDTNFFYRTYEITQATRWEYQFIVDYDRVVADTNNPRRAFGNKNLSEVFTPGWNSPDFLGKYQGDSPGRIERFHFTASSSRFSGPIEVYLPNGYAPESRRSLILVLDGDDWIQQGKLPDILNHQLEETPLAPVVAFVPGFGVAELGGWRTRRFAKTLASELVPEIERRYNTRSTRSDRTILGKRGAGVAAVFATLANPDIFGNCAVISYGRADSVRADQIREMIENSQGAKPVFHLNWCRYEVWRPQSFDCRQQNLELKDVLTANDFVVSDEEHSGGAGWGTWRIQAGQIIAKLAKSSSTD